MYPENDWSFLRRYLAPYRYQAIILVFLALASAVLATFSVALVVPLLSNLQSAADVAALPGVLRPLARYVAVYPFEQRALLLVGAILLLTLFKNVLFALAIMLTHWLSGRLAADMRLQAISLLLNVDIAYINRHHSGTHLDNVISNTMHVEKLIRSATEFCVNATILMALFGLMTLLSWQLTAVILLALALAGFLLAHYLRRLAERGHRHAVTRADLVSRLSETLSGSLVIRYLVQEKRELERLQSLIERYRAQFQSQQTFTYLMGTVTETFGVIGVAVLLAFAFATGQLATSAGVTRLLAFLVILVRMLPTVKELSRTRSMTAAHYPYLARVAALLRRTDKPFMVDGTLPVPPLREAIHFRAVTFTYPGADHAALRDVDVVIPRGKTTALLGPSGSGKTTLIHLLLRLHDPQQGDIALDGIPLTHFRLAQLRHAIGIVGQDTFLFDDTAFNNIAFGAAGPVERTAVINAASAAGAHDFIAALPQGYETRLGERGVRLSGGQRQRIAIARAVLRDPDILILDEATSALDRPGERAIHRALLKPGRQRTVIVIAHRLSTTYDADHVVILREGRVVEAGSRERLLAQPDGALARIMREASPRGRAAHGREQGTPAPHDR